LETEYSDALLVIFSYLISAMGARNTAPDLLSQPFPMR
jgi:hypothetical protein